MAAAARTLAAVVGAYVLCPLAIVLMRAAPATGLAAVLALAMTAAVLRLNARRLELLRRRHPHHRAPRLAAFAGAVHRGGPCVGQRRGDAVPQDVDAHV